MVMGLDESDDEGKSTARGAEIRQVGCSQRGSFARQQPAHDEAIATARDIARSRGTELYIHGRDGRIREKSSFGNDPIPPKG